MAQAAVAPPNFGSILDKPSTDSVRPPPAPVGQYVAAVKGLPRRDKSTKKGTDYIEYTFQPLQAVEGTVDEDDLKAYGGLKDKEWKLTFYMTEKSAFRHTEFLDNDLNLEDDGGSHWERAQGTAGCQCIVTIKHEASDDGKSVYSNIASTAPVG